MRRRRPLPSSSSQQQEQSVIFNAFEKEKEERRKDSKICWYLLKHLFCSRLCLFLVQFVSGSLIPDHSTDAFIGLVPSSDELNVVDRTIIWLFDGFRKWDSYHFLHIARFGYTFEHCLAFFPLFPLILRYGAWMMGCVIPIHETGALLFTAFLVNLIAFVIAGQVLFWLLLRLSKGNRCVAMIGVLLFAYNPASIFFSAVYSESLYSLFTFMGMAALYSADDGLDSQRRYIVSAAAFALSVLTRSNGMLNCVYIAHRLCAESITRMGKRYIKWSNLLGVFLYRSFRLFALGGLSATIMFTPIGFHYLNVISDFCNRPKVQQSELVKMAVENDFVLPGQLLQLPWCSEMFPNFYGHIQKKYWNVSPFGYWQFRKIPCFLLAAPVLTVAGAGVFSYFRRWKDGYRDVLELMRDKQSELPFVLHTATMAILGLLLYNVEVSTRILFSSTPFLYLYLARVIVMCGDESLTDFSDGPLFSIVFRFWSSGTIGRIVLLYFGGYFLLGTILFANFLPFT